MIWEMISVCRIIVGSMAGYWQSARFSGSSLFGLLCNLSIEHALSAEDNDLTRIQHLIRSKNLLYPTVSRPDSYSIGRGS